MSSFRRHQKDTDKLEKEMKMEMKMKMKKPENKTNAFKLLLRGLSSKSEENREMARGTPRYSRKSF